MIYVLILACHLMVGLIMLSIYDDDSVDNWCSRGKYFVALRVMTAIAFWPLFLWLQRIGRL